MLVDSHVNLHGEKYEDDLDEVLARAHEAGIGAMLAISDQLSSQPAIQAISSAHEHIWHSVGVHPHHAKDYPELTAAELIELARQSEAVGIGECGLDLYYEYSKLSDQEPVFQAHIEAAQELQLPLIIHTRNADDQMQGMLSEADQVKPLPLLMHCYTSGMSLAQKALELGAYISFSGILTFRKADDVRAIADMVPLDRLLIETDCPYLAPVPHRGRRCEPAHVVHVADKLAELKNVTPEEIARVTTDNFFRLFSKADRSKALVT
ncbi:TatD family hydrolase [Parvularcula sp. IMCC14364]|uniref:TatD family hydrolase n=1 Tax=Parvularcula sp. IMCC14364 TaxID=3067902 RepID=UPI002741BB80|nr:TatD family hydrolase [Parvularcula sp. IMCC14364]